jgi:macrolide transport system ATP-binding/permease protein
MESPGHFFRKLERFFLREKFNRELEEEMAFHREQSERELRSAGMAADAARHAARRGFGNDMRLREQSHEVVGFHAESVLKDLRFALRQLGRNPGFAFTVTLILALGIGASVAIFAFVDAALIKPLPYRDPGRLVSVFEKTAACPQCNVSYLNFRDWKRSDLPFSSLDAWGFTTYLLRTPAARSLLPARG